MPSSKPGERLNEIKFSTGLMVPLPEHINTIFSIDNDQCSHEYKNECPSAMAPPGFFFQKVNLMKFCLLNLHVFRAPIDQFSSFCLFAKNFLD